MIEGKAKREAQRLQNCREELIELLTQLVSRDGDIEVFPGLILSRSSKPTQPLYLTVNPVFCVIAQGSKQVVLGDEVILYDSGKYLISTIDLPIASHVAEASKEKPYLSVRLHLDSPLVAEILMEAGIENKRSHSLVKAINFSPVDADLLDAVVRLTRLFDAPDKIEFLAPLIIREIIFLLLKGDQGARLSHLLISEGETQLISKAIANLRKHFDEPLKIENVARDLGMSVSGFHHHFKSVTALSPVQFLKQIRLLEARRLMLGECLDVANAGLRVGYKDPAYFSRAYKNFFGVAPQHDMVQIRSNLEN